MVGLVAPLSSPGTQPSMGPYVLDQVSYVITQNVRMYFLSMIGYLHKLHSLAASNRTPQIINYRSSV